MIGGEIVHLAFFPCCVVARCRDRDGDEESIRVTRDVRAGAMALGDHLWRQSSYAFWTPGGVRRTGKGKSDIRLTRGCKEHPQ